MRERAPIRYKAVINQKGEMETMIQEKTYKGPLGSFSYSTADFAVETKYTPLGPLQILRYRGKETDGLKIQIPMGLLDASYMFENKSLVTPPVIPVTVQRADYMFLNCVSLVKGAVFPYGMKSASFAYSGCRSLVEAPGLPSTMKNASFLFDGCRLLVKPPILNKGLENTTGMFRNCFRLESFADLPKSVVKSEHMYRGCRALADVLGDAYESADINAFEPVSE